MIYTFSDSYWILRTISSLLHYFQTSWKRKRGSDLLLLLKYQSLFWPKLIHVSSCFLKCLSLSYCRFFLEKEFLRLLEISIEWFIWGFLKISNSRCSAFNKLMPLKTDDKLKCNTSTWRSACQDVCSFFFFFFFQFKIMERPRKL